MHFTFKKVAKSKRIPTIVETLSFHLYYSKISLLKAKWKQENMRHVIPRKNIFAHDLPACILEQPTSSDWRYNMESIYVNYILKFLVCSSNGNIPALLQSFSSVIQHYCKTLQGFKMNGRFQTGIIFESRVKNDTGSSLPIQPPIT